MEEVIITGDQYCKPEPLAMLGLITRAEASGLIKNNPAGVRKFFRRKGCDDVGEKLQQNQISGATLEHLCPKAMEELGLNLGQRLSLQAFRVRFQSAARAAKRSEKLWEADELVREETLSEGGACCGLLSCFDCRFECRNPCLPPIKHVHLPPARYTLTNTVLKLSGSAWMDEYQGERRKVDFQGCPCCWRAVETPSRTSVDTIDLSLVTDVDFVINNQKAETYEPDCAEHCAARCTGWKKTLLGAPPSEIIVTYTQEGETLPLRRILSVNAAEAEKICESILAAKEEAQAESAGSGAVEM